MKMSAVTIPSDLQLKMSGLIIRDENKQITRREDDDKRDTERATHETDTEIQRVFHSICLTFIEDLNRFGIAVMDTFLGNERGDLVYEEVINLRRANLFSRGQTVRSDITNKDIRSDEIMWLVGNERSCPNIHSLINDIDQIVITANKLPNNGELGKYRINRRTKVMVACYPGNGTHYVKHVDNPNKDGRVLTAIYYLNKNWDPKLHGGMLRIFPTDVKRQVADIVPEFDRMLFFWSDRRNPHEVQPSFRTRYAITVWYFDAVEQKARDHGDPEADSDEEKRNVTSEVGKPQLDSLSSSEREQKPLKSD